MKALFILLAAMFVFTSFSPANLPAATNEDVTVIENEPLPRTTSICLTVFGGEIFCWIVEDTKIILPKGDELRIGAEFDSRGRYMNMKFPSSVKNGKLVVTEEITFKLCDAGRKTIRKGTEINIRNGEAKVSLR